jgi:capsule polysaccharide export protein KpsE/RkpR
MSYLKDMYKVKKKRAVDPNAPPRPNLMTHEVKLRTAQQTVEALENQVRVMTARIESLEAKARSQTQYLQALHDQVVKRK